MKKCIGIAIVLAFFMQGCVAALIGGGAYHSAKSKKAQQEFTSNYQRINMERESKGLEPLDWCSEAYRFDKGFAKRDTNCRKRIAAYEGGDNSALGRPMLQSDVDSLPEPPKRKSGSKYSR